MSKREYEQIGRRLHDYCQLVRFYNGIKLARSEVKSDQVEKLWMDSNFAAAALNLVTTIEAMMEAIGLDQKWYDEDDDDL